MLMMACQGGFLFKNKNSLESQIRVKEKWVLPFEVIPIVNIPKFGDKITKKMCNEGAMVQVVAC